MQLTAGHIHLPMHISTQLKVGPTKWSIYSHLSIVCKELSCFKILPEFITVMLGDLIKQKKTVWSNLKERRLSLYYFQSLKILYPISHIGNFVAC